MATLFDGDDKLFKGLITSSKVYGEYGCGLSTIWAAKETNSLICSVDTSKEWVEKVTNELSLDEQKRVGIHHIDVGECHNWGFPRSYKYRHNFIKYIESIWCRKTKPDLILIDGRFRVSCFLMSLLNANEGAHIIFDDYINREYYHVVEEYVDVEKIYGRQALFIVPPKNKLKLTRIKQEIEHFLFVLN